MKQVIRLEIEQAEQEIGYLKARYLRQRGWTYTCATPGSRWMWTKSYRGRIMVMYEESALAVEKFIESPELAERAFVRGEKVLYTGLEGTSEAVFIEPYNDTHCTVRVLGGLMRIEWSKLTLPDPPAPPVQERCVCGGVGCNSCEPRG